MKHQQAKKEEEKKERQCSNLSRAHTTREKGWKGEETTIWGRGRPGV
jgi:hypothetical protein